MYTIPMRPLGFGEIVDGAVQLYRRDFGLYYLIGLVCSLPEYVLLVLWNPWEVLASLDALEPGDDPSASLDQLGTAFGTLGYAFLILGVGLVFMWFAALSLTVAIADRIEARPTSIGAAFKGALPRIPGAAGATVVALLMFLAVQFVVFLGTTLIGAVGMATASVGFLIGWSLVVAAVLTVVTIFWLGATFGVFPAIVLEGRRAMDALSRSFSLCRKGWLRVMGVMVVAFIVWMTPGVAIQGLFGTWTLFQDPGDVASIGPMQQWLINTADLVLGPLTLPFMVGCVMMLFHDRRVRSEAYDLERLALDMESAGP